MAVKDKKEPNKYPYYKRGAPYEELMRCGDAGFSFPDSIFEFTDVTQLNEGELEEYKLILARARHLGHGEIHSIIIARFRRYPFLTNDKIAKKFAKEYGVEAWEIPDILKALWAKGVKSKEENKRIISEMEKKDRMGWSFRIFGRNRRLGTLA